MLEEAQLPTTYEKRRPVSLTVRADLIREAKNLNLNASRSAEDGSERAVKKAKEAAWLEEKLEVIIAHNEGVATSSIPTAIFAGSLL